MLWSNHGAVRIAVSLTTWDAITYTLMKYNIVGEAIGIIEVVAVHRVGGFHDYWDELLISLVDDVVVVTHLKKIAVLAIASDLRCSYNVGVVLADIIIDHHWLVIDGFKAVPACAMITICI